MTPKRSQTRLRPDPSDDPNPEPLAAAIQSASKALETLKSLQLILALAQPLEGKIDFCREVREFEICLIRRALDYSGGRQNKAAALLNLKPTTLNMKIKSYNLGTTPNADFHSMDEREAGTLGERG